MLSPLVDCVVFLITVTLSQTSIVSGERWTPGEPAVSHSGPSTDDGRSFALIPDVFKIRAKRGYYSNSYEYSMLINAGPPNSYMKDWITEEHNKYRRMVRRK